MSLEAPAVSPGLGKLVRDVSVYLGSGVIRKVVLFFLVPIYTRFLTQPEFGALDLVIAMGSLFAIVAELQLPTGVARYFYEHASAGRGADFLGETLVLRIALGVVVMGAGMAGAGPIATWLIPGIPDGVVVVRLYFCLALVAHLESGLLLCLRLVDRTVAFSILNVVGTLVQAGLAILGVVVLRLGLVGVLAAEVAGTLSVVVVALWLLWGAIAWRRPGQAALEALRLSLPTVPAAVFAWGGIYLGRILMSRFLSLDQVAVFALVMKMVVILQFVANSMRLAWQPLSMRAASLDGRSEFYRDAFELSMGALLLMSFLLTLFTGPLVLFLAGDAYREATYYVPAMVLGAVLATGTTFVDVGNQVARTTSNVSISTLAGTGLNLLVVAVGTQLVGLWAPALGYFCGSALNLSLLLVLTRRSFDLKYRSASLVGTAVCALAMVGLHPVMVANPLDSTAFWAATLVMTIAVGTGLVFVTGPGVRAFARGLWRR